MRAWLWSLRCAGSVLESGRHPAGGNSRAELKQNAGAHWRKQMPVLAQDRQVFALDLLGFGRSDKPLLAYSIDLWRDLVLDFATEFTGQGAILIGNSIGSLVCLAVRACACMVSAT